MTDAEIRFYQQMRNVPADKSLAASKAAMYAASEARFKEREAARLASIARVDPMHEAMRKVILENPAYSEVKAAAASVKAAAARPAPPQLPKLAVPPRPPASRLRLASVHLVDTAPFQAMTWQSVSIYGGNSQDAVVSKLTADDNGYMSFALSGGGVYSDSNSSGSCWCAIGQTYVMPPDVAKSETGGATLRFTASPSFRWNVDYGSNLWRLSSGNIWIGQVVNRFDQNWTLIDTPVSYQTNLYSWYDHNFGDSSTPSGSTSAYSLSTTAFVQPNYFYDCWVWIGAYAFGDAVDSGSSWSNVFVDANVSSLIFDSL
jgi:hypothetical protein